MKLFAIITTLLLHSIGLWSQVDPVAKTHLADQALGLNSVSTPKPSTLVTAFTLPVQQRESSLDLTGEHVLAVDAATMMPLFSKAPNAKVPIASITKTVTILTILKYHTLDQIVTIKKLPTYAPDDDTIGLVEGDRFTVRQLIQAALIPSANDAADALAIWDAGSIPAFTSKMNATLAAWGITDSHFVSASGLQDINNTATATDLARIGKLILTNHFIAQTVKTRLATITSVQNRTYNLTNTNALLENNLLYGIKTGYTGAAGECLLGITQIDGHAVITVVLGATDRFSDTERLINWIGSSYQWL